MFLQPLDCSIHCGEPKDSGLLRIHAIRVGTQASITADFVVGGVSTRNVIEGSRQLASHAVAVAVDLFLITISGAATDEHNPIQGSAGPH